VSNETSAKAPQDSSDEVLTKLLLSLWAVTKPLAFAKDFAVYQQIGTDQKLEGPRVLIATIAALTLDAVMTSWLCAKHDALRQVTVLQRQLFEYSVRTCYYVVDQVIADRHWRSTNQQFLRVARKLQGEGTPEFKEFEKRVLANDSGFSSGTNAQTSAKPNLSEMCNRIYGKTLGERFYGLHYTIPSAVAHGAPAAFADVFEQVGTGYRLRVSGAGMKSAHFALAAIAQCGINVAGACASVFDAPKVVESVVLAEKFYSSFGFDKSLLVPRHFTL